MNTLIGILVSQIIVFSSHEAFAQASQMVFLKEKKRSPASVQETVNSEKNNAGLMPPLDVKKKKFPSIFLEEQRQIQRHSK